MGKFQRELILAIAREYDLRFYDMGQYIKVLNDFGEEKQCRSVADIKDFIGED